MGLSVSEIIKAINGTPSHLEEIKVEGVVSSSSHQIASSAYVAIRGTKHDGHNYIDEAFSHGSTVAIVEDEKALRGKPGIVVADSRKALSILADIFADSPTRFLPVIGVTGTNGKTTTHWLIAKLLEGAQQSPLRIGTIGIYAQGCIDDPGALTTPDPISLHTLFLEAFKKKCTHAVMEVSSHALDQKRVDDVRYAVAVFTNLTRDHLDYHETMEKYAEAKKHLFHLLGTIGRAPKCAIINIDDPYGSEFCTFAKNAGCHVVTYGESTAAEFRITSFHQTVEGSSFDLQHREGCVPVHSSFIGRYNAYNLTAALLAASQCGCPLALLAELAPSLPQVPGRLESVGDRGIGVYVDYAHTPDALENALCALKELVEGKLWVVFGCGGDRDKGKRPLMATIAAKYADCVVVTSDNPRTEDPQQIINDILTSGIEPTLVEVDRRSAIIETIRMAKEGDVVLIAGKGHENYQIIGTTKINFSDAEIVRSFFNRE